MDSSGDRVVAGVQEPADYSEVMIVACFCCDIGGGSSFLDNKRITFDINRSTCILDCGYALGGRLALPHWLAMWL